MFYPMTIPKRGNVGVAVLRGFPLNKGDRDRPLSFQASRPQTVKAGERGLRASQIPSVGLGPMWLEQRGWRGELPAWRQAEPV